MGKTLSPDEAAAFRKELKAAGKKVVFTNGCFDILHVGHIRYLFEARKLGDALIVGLNSDVSVKRLKGETRPYYPQNERAEILSAIEAVDAVVIFENETPLELITGIMPDVLVKGGDWSVDKIVGRDVVENGGGKVMSLGFVDGRSTSGILDKIGKK